jgi:hypothetical protein
VEVEQSAFRNTPGLQQVRLDLACTRIRRETFDVFGENGDVTAIVAFDQRRENPVTVVTEAAHSLSGESVMEGVSQRDSVGT